MKKIKNLQIRIYNRKDLQSMKKFLSIILTICLAFSVLTVGAASVSAAEGDIPAGTVIYFDNTSTKWDNVYFYAWKFGFFGDTYELSPISEDSNLYSMVLPQDVTPGETFFLFKSAEDWSGKQTADQAAYVGLNTYVPLADAAGNVMTVDMENTVLPAETEVLITPSSRDFTTDTLDVTVYAFNAASAKYTVSYDDGTTVGPIEFTNTATVEINDSATVILTAGEKVMVQTYTKASDAIVNVTAEGYTGDIFMYTFGGDRIGDEFVPMTKNEDGKYTAKINGSAQVIFTTTNDWKTAKKFTITTINGETPTAVEPLLTAGATYNIVLQVPAV